ncbi:hypothetical protein [Taylorella equigenitalis]|uniref:hypothetical protein n=2 Tax=Taylorella equigenitalis TaxID=29575 RepID=UPI00237D7096|nr:hypothetical protein [Taylorella equigenitalis]WDU51568.1 hypothetical protein KNO32_06295 [Taylorella equigenitalis]
MDRQDFLNSFKPAVSKVEFEGKSVFLRDLSIGDMNHTLFIRKSYLINKAQEQGVELNFDNEEVLNNQLQKVDDEFTLARMAAMRLCDESGNLYLM